jgi:UDP-N-acetylmuramoyl-tripeptide--D-alanyl-D-alanine ligase
VDIKFDEILKATRGTALSVADESFPACGVSTDSRFLERSDCFFALIGKRFDGHAFVAEAVSRGATHLVVSDPASVTEDQKKLANVILVKDTLEAYGDLAKFYRQKFRVPAVAVTGSAGKTTVKELIAQVLAQRFCVLKNRGTENNLVGVPKTLFQLEASHEVLVLEMGTNAPGEIERLSSIIAPQVGVVTLIGAAHLEGLKNLDGVREEKLKLVKQVERGGWLVLNGEDPHLGGVQSGVHRISRVAFSKERGSWFADRIRHRERGISFYLNGKDCVETCLIGRHNVLNCLFAAAVGAALGVDWPLILKGLESFKAAPGRLQLKMVEGIQFLDDSYNANPSSFEAALDALRELKTRAKKGVVFGDMLELGAETEAQHRLLGRRLAACGFDFVIGTGEHARLVLDEALKHGLNSKKIYTAADGAAAGKILRELAAAGDCVLVKGSRGMKMEKVFECFITSSTL